MCGFAGLYQRRPSAEASERFVARALRCLARRGPDDARALRRGPLDLVHTRLSIIDAAGGAQPMESEAGLIVYNGEIYNHEELRRPDTPYASRSDTEVLLRGLDAEGLGFLEEADGMFGFAYYAKGRDTLYVARDRFGIKPAYVLKTTEGFAFGLRGHSLTHEGMALLAPLSGRRINRQAYLQYYAARSPQAPNTIFEDVHEVPAGHVAVYDCARHTLEIRPWAAPIVAETSREDEATLLERLDALLHASVRRHLVSDVPVASFLSGGIDSGLLTAIASRYVPDLAAFSIGFRDPRYDESPYAQAVARRYGLRHYVKFVDAETVFGLLDDWPGVVDDVNAEPSSVMRAVVAQFARESGFKVVLSGEGADELFGGYNQYRRFALARRLARLGRHLPGPLADRAEAALGPRTRLAHFLRQAAGRQAYPGTSMVFEPHLFARTFVDEPGATATATTLRGALDLDRVRRLPDDMLTATDRATMHASIEARVPFVTRSVAEFAASLPDAMVLRGGRQKVLLRQLALEKYLPRACVVRRKVGFDMPLASWFRGRLRDVVHDTLADTWQADFLRPGAMARIVAAHMGGRADFADKIWAFVVLDRNVRALNALA